MSFFDKNLYWKMIPTHRYIYIYDKIKYEAM